MGCSGVEEGFGVEVELSRVGWSGVEWMVSGMVGDRSVFKLSKDNFLVFSDDCAAGDCCRHVFWREKVLQVSLLLGPPFVAMHTTHTHNTLQNATYNTHRTSHIEQRTTHNAQRTTRNTHLFSELYTLQRRGLAQVARYAVLADTY